MNAHRFLEIYNETMTVRELRESLRSTGAIDAGRVKLVPITYILIFKYKVDWHELVNRSQGDNREEMEAAQKMLDEVKVLFKTAEEELEAALAEVKSQEDAYNSRTEELKKKSETGGVVSRNKAANELAQHLAEDPLPLRKAKITLEAAVKRSEKATKAAADAREAAEASASAASKARESAEQAANQATQARAQAEKDAAAASSARESASAARAQASSAREAASAARAEAERARAASEKKGSS